jgi:penicillin amidase
VKRILFIVFVLAVSATAGGVWWWARQSLPVLDGEQQVSGLVGPVEVIFDQYGVPHVYAGGAEDAWAAAGMLHARERLWQMELYRRAANGRLSEILGERALPVDKRLLTLELRRAAEAEWESASPAVRTALTRYAEGVNAQMALAVGRSKPLEFQILRFDPAPWTPVDSLIVGRLLAWRLAENHHAELVRSALASRFGMADAQRLAGTYPATAPTVIQRSASAPAPPPVPPAPPARKPAGVSPGRTGLGGSPIARREEKSRWPAGLEWLDPGARRGLSNNFVASGARTTSGRPLLANDPHLQIEFPSVWYEMHLVAAEFDVMGVTIPGAPFVIIGHNARVAWGVTNTGADVQDLYIERVDLARRRYFAGGQWHPVQVIPAEIPVRDRQAEPFEVWRTRHGPIHAEVGLDWEEPPAWLTRGNERTGERRVFAMRWDVSGETAGAFEAINRAANWREFTAAVERFTAPSQNFVYADVDGNIGYAMSGVLPLRSSGSGMTPVDGERGDGEWVGHVNPSALPRAFNPAAGYITSSNNEIDRLWSGTITRDWAAPFRAIRLHQQLSKEKLGLGDAAQLQNDLMSVAAERVLAGAEAAIKRGRASGASEISIRALEQLQAWDRKVDARPVAALYQAFEDALWRRTFADEMGEELFDVFYEWAGAERPSGLYAIIDESGVKWFDDIGTIDRRETRDDIFLLAARDAMERLERDHGSFDDWNWGAIHAARFTHPLSPGGMPLRWLFDRGPSEISGDGTTVMRVSFNRLRPYQAWEIPSWRQVLDVGNWDESQVVLPAGQSGHPLSPHYFDQNEMWRLGKYRVQPFTRAAVDAARAHRLLLLP